MFEVMEPYLRAVAHNDLELVTEAGHDSSVEVLFGGGRVVLLVQC
jgi:hypothetical protein